MIKHTCPAPCHACEADFIREGGFVPREELRGTSTDAPSSSAEVGIPAGRPGASRPANSSGPPWLPDLLAIFGWSGGTIHQALDEVRKLRDVAEAANRWRNSTELAPAIALVEAIDRLNRRSPNEAA